MTTQPIDPHYNREHLELALQRLDENRHGITRRNVELIRKYCQDSLLGKTVLHGRKRRIGPSRVLRCLCQLQSLAFWFGKDFEHVAQDDMERFITRLEANQLEYFVGAQPHRGVAQHSGRLVRKNYTPLTRNAFKLLLKQFYKWLLGNNEVYPPVVSWIDTHVDSIEIPALTLEQVERLVDYARSARDKAIIMLLFESGARITEFLNIRLRNLEEKGNYTSVRIEVSKTFPRTVMVYRSKRHLADWLKIHPDKDNPEAQLFPLEYRTIGMMLRRVAKRVIGRTITPHVLRHSCATWLAGKRIGRFQICKWMGWTMSSAMPDRYIDRAGVTTEDTVRVLHEDEVTQLRRENEDVRRELGRAQLTQQPAGGIAEKMTQELMRDPVQLREFVASVLRERGGKA